jgi:hypothetical protein
MPTNVVADQANRLTLDLLEELFVGDAAQKASVRLWDGTRWPDDAPRPVTLVLKPPAR